MLDRIVAFVLCAAVVVAFFQYEVREFKKSRKLRHADRLPLERTVS